MLDAGATLSQTSRATGVSRAALRSWRATAVRHRPGGCPSCDDRPLGHGSYSALLGFYLGDGHISRAARYFALRISCDAKYPGIISDVHGSIEGVRPDGRVFLVRAPGAVVVQSHWKHWPCLFPQHGPGRKHERPIILQAWQAAIVERHPADFLRGLFHSDGCRVNNWATRVVAGESKRYDYPRWQFTNNSDDIRRMCAWALDRRQRRLCVRRVRASQGGGGRRPGFGRRLTTTQRGACYARAERR